MVSPVVCHSLDALACGSGRLATNASMPRSSTLPPVCQRSSPGGALPSGGGTASMGRLPDVALDEGALKAIVARVREATHVDVGLYKGSTFERQLLRRLKELGLPGLAQYAQLLEHDEDELHRLQESLLISVTGFFRDQAVFERMGKLIEETLRSPIGPPEGLRFWVAGCASGEEALSLAILVAEALGSRLGEVPVRIFATDVDQQAIARARQGLYPESALRDVPANWRQRYFSQVDEQFRPSRVIREMCVFAHHDLLAEPPFVNLDLVSCRNLLIYLKPEVQNLILQRFHQALGPSGWLLLGQSESVGVKQALFELPDPAIKLYRRVPDVHARAKLDALGIKRPLDHGVLRQATIVHSQPSLEARFHQVLMQHHVPPSVLVDAQGRVLHLFGQTARFLRLEQGRADFSLAGLCVPGLRADVRTLLHLAVSGDEAQEHRREVILDDGLQPRHLLLRARLMRHVVRDEPVVVALTFCAAQAELGDDPVFDDRLVSELRQARADVHRLVTQLDSSESERQMLREELQATSEELQSSNEELQASNEELSTLNEQLLDKSQSLERLNETLQSVERSMQVALVVLDARMRVLRFNALSVRIFGLLEHDIGRPLMSVPCNLPIDDLGGRIAQVLESGEGMVLGIDHEARHFVLQISVLRSSFALADGVILMFTDVSQLRRAEFEQAQLAAIVQSSEDATLARACRATSSVGIRPLSACLATRPRRCWARPCQRSFRKNLPTARPCCWRASPLARRWRPLTLCACVQMADAWMSPSPCRPFGTARVPLSAPPRSCATSARAKCWRPKPRLNASAWSSSLSCAPWIWRRKKGTCKPSWTAYPAWSPIGTPRCDCDTPIGPIAPRSRRRSTASACT